MIKDFEATNLKVNTAVQLEMSSLPTIIKAEERVHMPPTAPSMEQQTTYVPPKPESAQLVSATAGAPSGSLPPHWTGTAPAHQAVFNGNGVPT